MLSGGLAMKSSKVKFFCAAVAVTIVIYSLLVNLLVTIMSDRQGRSHFYRHFRNYTVTPSGRATQADLLLIATAFNLSVVGITGISGDRLMQINQFLKANALAGLGNAYLCLEEHEEAIDSYQKSFNFVF
jgi:hypothetical protein